MSAEQDEPIRLVEVVRSLSLARSLRAFADTLEAVGQELFAAPRVEYWRYNNATHKLIRVATGVEHPCSESDLVGAAFLNCEFVCHSQDRLALFDGDQAFKEAIAFPIKLYGTPTGVLLIVDPVAEVQIPWEEISDVAGISQENAIRSEDSNALMVRTEELLVAAVERVAAGQQGHVARVGQLAAEIATLMDLSVQSRQLILRAAQYHDVGKLILVGSPQIEQEKLHAQVGADYLRGTRILKDLAPLVEGHHERYDGSGPRGWKAGQMPTEAWVLALAEDLEEHRLRRPNDPVAIQIRTFFEGAANLHHPAAVDALGGLLVSGRLEQLLT